MNLTFRSTSGTAHGLSLILDRLIRNLKKLSRDADVHGCDNGQGGLLRITYYNGELDNNLSILFRLKIDVGQWLPLRHNPEGLNAAAYLERLMIASGLVHDSGQSRFSVFRYTDYNIWVFVE